MDFMPLFVDMRGKKVLVVGAGRIAYRKIKTLLKYGASVEVITLEIAEKEIKTLGIDIHIRPFSREDILDKFLVAAATDDERFNSEIVKLCNDQNILVNNMTTKTDLNCRFAASLETEEFQIAISARGYPKKSKALKEKIKDLI